MAENKKQKKGANKPLRPRAPKTVRKEAEERLRSATVHADDLSAMDLKKLVHELRVHQIELEMQNEELRKTQAELEESRSRYADLYDFAPTGYLTINEKGLIIESNLTAAKQLGTERSQLMNKPFTGFIHKDDQDMFYLHRKAVLENRTQQACEIRVTKKDRSLFYARLECLAVRDMMDEVHSIRITVIDITERVQAEAELKIKQYLNEVLLDSLPHPAMLIRKDRIILAANRIAREVGAKVGGHCWQEFGHGEYIPDKDKIYIAEHKMVPACGTQCYFCKSNEAMHNQASVSTEVNSFNRLWDTYWVPLDNEIYLHYALDITDQKQVEEQLRILSKFPSESPNPVLRISDKGEILYANEAAARLLKKHVIKEKDIAKILPANFRDLVVKSLASKKAVHDVEVNVGEKTYSYSIAPIPESLYVNFYASDVTERKLVEEKLKVSYVQLEKANRELSDFAYIVSHDLKEPLRALNSLAKWIVDDYGDKFDEAGKEKIELLIGRVRRMNDLVDGIFRYSRAGQVKYGASSLDLNQIVYEVAGMLAPPGHISVSIEGTLPIVVFDRSCMQQVMQNLIENAVKYMDKPEGSIKISAAEDNGFWKICVSDNGPGIDKKDYGKIFQMFGVLQPRDRVNASGVGLAIVKKIVEMYGGQVWVESEVGKGSWFYFTIPK